MYFSRIFETNQVEIFDDFKFFFDDCMHLILNDYKMYLLKWLVVPGGSINRHVYLDHGLKIYEICMTRSQLVGREVHILTYTYTAVPVGHAQVKRGCLYSTGFKKRLNIKNINTFTIN